MLSRAEKLARELWRRFQDRRKAWPYYGSDRAVSGHPIDQGAFKRAQEETQRFGHTVAGRLAEVVGTALGVGLATLIFLGSDSPGWAKVVVPLVSAVVGFWAVLGLVYSVSLVVAPVHQRDEARLDLWRQDTPGGQATVFKDLRHELAIGEELLAKLEPLAKTELGHPAIHDALAWMRRLEGVLAEWRPERAALFRRSPKLDFPGGVDDPDKLFALFARQALDQRIQVLAQIIEEDDRT